MSGLLLVFILATVALMLQVSVTQTALGQKVQEAEAQKAAFDAQVGTISEAEKVRTEILTETSKRLKAAGIEVQVNTDTAVLSIPTAALGFTSGSYAIEPRYADRAAKIGQVLSDVLRDNGRTAYLDTVFVEGHTDSDPFKGPLGMDNWGLSTFRAISLWQLWGRALPAGTQLDALKNADGHPLFSVSGYSDTRPTADTPKGVHDYAGNRRIDIRITIVRPSSAELERIADGFTVGAGK